MTITNFYNLVHYGGWFHRLTAFSGNEKLQKRKNVLLSTYLDNRKFNFNSCFLTSFITFYYIGTTKVKISAIWIFGRNLNERSRSIFLFSEIYEYSNLNLYHIMFLGFYGTSWANSSQRSWGRISSFFCFCSIKFNLCFLIL